MTSTATEKPAPVPWTLPKNRRGAEYNLEAGLDWDRIRAEYEVNQSERERFTGPMGVKLLLSGMGATERGATCEAAWQKELKRREEAASGEADLSA